MGRQQQQQHLRKRDPTSPELPKLNKDIHNRMCAEMKKLRDFVETMDQKTDMTKLWRTIKGIGGRAKREAENEAITCNGISFSSSKQLAPSSTNSSIFQSWADILLQERPE